MQPNRRESIHRPLDAEINCTRETYVDIRPSYISVGCNIRLAVITDSVREFCGKFDNIGVLSIYPSIFVLYICPSIYRFIYPSVCLSITYIKEVTFRCRLFVCLFSGLRKKYSTHFRKYDENVAH